MQNSCKAHSVSEIPATMHMKIWRRSAVAQICLSAYRWVTDSFSPSGCFQTLYWILILSVWGCMQTHFAFPPEPSSWARAKETKEIHSKVTCRISKVRSRVALFAFRLHLLLWQFGFLPMCPQLWKVFMNGCKSCGWCTFPWATCFAHLHLAANLLAGRASRVRDLIHFLQFTRFKNHDHPSISPIFTKNLKWEPKLRL